MDLFSIWHWLIVGAVLLLLFGGRGKISGIMGDLGKGIRAFKTGIAETDEASPPNETPPAGSELADADRQHAEPANHS